MRLILLGSPGSGKGTQAKLLSDRLDLVHVGTGDILREAMRQGTPQGKQAAPFVNKGQLVPDSLVNEMVQQRFLRSDRPGQFVMDGYPRTLAQAKSFDQTLAKQAMSLEAVVFVNVPDEKIVQRLSARWSCPECKSTYHSINCPPQKPGVCDLDNKPLIQRVDDQEATVRERLRLYHENTVDLILYYQSLGILYEISGEGAVEQVYGRILQVLYHEANPSC